METLYKCEYNIDKALWTKWAKENWLKGRQLGFMIMWIFFMIGCLIIFFALRNPLYLFLALFCAYRAFLRWMVLANRIYTMMAKEYGDNWIREICFTEDDIKMIDVKNTVAMDYSDIERIQESGSYIRIHLSNNKVIRLYTEKFTLGSWTECREFIESKTHLS